MSSDGYYTEHVHGPHDYLREQDTDAIYAEVLPS